MSLASTSTDELLSYLANDKDPAIRALVAKSKNGDDANSEEVKKVLGIKIAKALPQLAGQQNKKLTDLTYKILEDLVDDHAISVRRAVSESLKDVDCTPQKLAFKLAADAEREVACPMLRYSKALKEEDILNLIKQFPQAWRLVELAKRDDLSDEITHKLIQTEDRDIIGVLLDNQGNLLTEPDLEIVTDQAEKMSTLQPPLAHRPELPPNLAIKMANFVEEAVLKILCNRKDFDRQTLSEISETSQRRLAFRDDFEKSKNPKAYADKLYKSEKLDEDALKDALSWGEVTFITEAIAKRTQLSPIIIKNQPNL